MVTASRSIFPIALMALLGMPAAGQSLSGDGLAVLARPFPFQGSDVQISAVLQEMTQKTGVPVMTARNSGGRVSISNADGSLRSALDQVAVQGDVIWWFDGVAVHVEPSGAMTSRLIRLEGLSLDDLRQQMREIGLSDPQYPLHAGGTSGMVRIVGPQGYIDAVSELITHMADGREAPRRGLPRIIRGTGRHTAPEE